MDGLFLPRNEFYDNDFMGIMRNPFCEFDKGTHFHDFYEIQFYLNDAGKITVNHTTYDLHSGDIVLLNMFEPHWFVPSPGCYYQRFIIDLNPSILLSACTEKVNLLCLFDPDAPNYPIHHLPNNQFMTYRKLLLDYDSKNLTYGQEIYDRGITYEILANLYNAFHYNSPSASSSKDTIHVVTELLGYISEHLSEELSLPQLAELAHFSESYLCRVFRRYTGTTLKQYINLKRIEKAKQLLQNNVSSYEACRDAGFNNYSYFFRTFKSITGMSPKDYSMKRQNQQGIYEDL